MTNAIILTDEELEQRIDKRVSEKIQKLFKAPEKQKTKLDLDGAIEHLNEQGYKCSKSQIYKLTMKEEIPFSKFGRLISFDADSLTKWVETKKQKRVDVSGNVSRSANLKLR